MGELHLEIIVERLSREYGADFTIGQLQVAYKETISHSAEHETRFVKQTGGKRPVCPCYPLDWNLAEGFEFVSKVGGVTYLQEYIPA